MYEIGRLCVKIAGRDARLKCVIIEVLDDNYVMIDGQTRRRKCNIIHLEPLDKVLKIKKNASHSEVVTAFKAEKINVIETKPKKTAAKPKKQEKTKVEKPAKKATKKPEIKESKKKTEDVKEIKDSVKETKPITKVDEEEPKEKVKPKAKSKKPKKE